MPEEANRTRVVIAEDSVLIQESIRLVLPATCEIVALAEDGNAALEAVSRHNPDILLLDVSLPVLGGFAVTEKLQQAGSAVKVIFVTAHRNKTYSDAAIEIGARGYVLKGAMHVELPAAIRAVTGGGLYVSPLIR